MAAWDNFFVAEVGASAALAGLLFVGISINMQKIVALPALPYRAQQALTLLFGILVVASLMLVPGEANAIVGLELLVVGAAILAAAVVASSRALRQVAPPYHAWHARETALIALATALYPATGAVLLLVGSEGLYLLVPAFLLSFVVAIIDSWVLLVEINR